MIVKNKEELLSHGNRDARKVALDIIDHAVKSVDAYVATKKRVSVGDGRLTVGDLNYDLSTVGRIHVIGGGKATFSIAQALDEILGERIEEGIIIVKKGEKRSLKHIEVIEGGHPIPNEAGLEGTNKMLDIAEKVKKGDIVFCAITGGASALMPLPAGSISLKDKQKVTELLLKSGATIDEINTVRNHISAIKGGRLAKLIHPAEMINLIVIDEIAGRPWGPTVPDETTFKDAIKVLNKYSLWEKVPISVREHLKRGLVSPSLETPKPKDFEGLTVHNVVLADNRILCEAAVKRAQELGFSAQVLSTVLEGESREVGIVLASIAKEIAERGNPIKPPCVLVSGGETTVTIAEEHGRGGPSQELVLGASLKIVGSEKIVVASIDTDGTDGPTEIAGGIADGSTIKRAEEKGLDVFKNLVNHNSSEVLVKLQDAIITGPTGTNVMDLNIVVIKT